MASCRSVFFIFVLFCISILSETNSDPLQIHERIEERKPNSRAVVNLKGGPDSVIWVVQLSDLHFSVFHPDRALDFKRLVAPALAMINPALVLITGDLTDGKSKDLLIMKQDENEWIEYQKVMEDVIGRSGLDKNIFYDLRGNHDNFGVPKVGGSFDFFSKYSINGRLRRYGNVHSVTIKVCFGMLAYLFYLIFFPWCFGKVFTEGQVREYMTYKGWVVNISNESDKHVYVGYPDIMVVVLPHLVFVVLPAILVIGVLAAERGAFRVHYLLLSGKKEDDYDQKNKKSSMYVHKENKRLKLFLGGRWIRKLLLVVCLIIYWKHWRHCEALMKAYEMNPFLHFPVYCFSIPFLLGYAIYKTMES